LRETFEAAPRDGSFVADRSELRASHGVTASKARALWCSAISHRDVAHCFA
jgi:hypothetical protein